MIYDKPATSLREQIELLERRGMSIPDRKRAAHYLRHIGYYRLSAYWLPFEKPAPRAAERPHEFIAGTEFEHVLTRYVFDRKLRILLLEALERIEVSIRACWVNSFSLSHGPHGYLQAAHFKCPYWHANQIAKAAAALKASNEVFVEHYANKYADPGLPPMWVTAETISFGALSSWIQATRGTEVQTTLMRHLNLPTLQIVHGVLHNLSYLRNLCAHHARVWNRQFVKKYPRIKKMPEMLHPEACGKKSGAIYNHLAMLRHLMLHINPKTSWPRRLTALLQEQPPETRSAMHLPDQWHAVLSGEPEGSVEK